MVGPASGSMLRSFIPLELTSVVVVSGVLVVLFAAASSALANPVSEIRQRLIVIRMIALLNNLVPRSSVDLGE